MYGFYALKMLDQGFAGSCRLYFRKNCLLYLKMAINTGL